MTGDRVEEAMWRSVRWLDRCIAYHESKNKQVPQDLFAIIQGGLSSDLRNKCLDEMIKRTFPTLFEWNIAKTVFRAGA